ncbi:hypothetical protein KR054_006586 [Drosophila jambulina]|nr:hypothetical protein KR054_006586 [Drosophila jambulina]
MKLTREHKRNLLFCAFATVILMVCCILIAFFSGFYHEQKTFKIMMMTLLVVVIVDLLFWEPIRFLVLAIDHATWPSVDQQYTQEEGNAQPSHFTYLKTRLRSRRSEVLITEEHRNEALNQTYKTIASDLWLYGLYLLALLLHVLAFQDKSLYYITDMMFRLFGQDTATTMGLSKIYFQYEFYQFFTSTLDYAFNANKSIYRYDGWYAMEQWKMLGAIRLRQLRIANKKIGLLNPKWDNQTYAPEWKLPYQHLYYTDRFWRVFDPFTPMDVEPGFLDGILLNFQHLGYLHRYPELGGYMTLMVKTLVSTRLQINYLRETNWLDRKTVALFIDFSLYNVDANAFMVITMRIENSPFGTQLTHLDVDCVRVLGAGAHTSWYQTLLLGIYMILVLQFGRGLARKLYYDPASIKQAWNLVDLFICLLNGFLLILYFVRELVTTDILETIQTMTNEQYLGMQRALRLHNIIAITTGLLISITTLRLWKVLQFAPVFQHFSRTLAHAWKAVISLGVTIIFLLMGLGIALSLPNGNNAEKFRHLIYAIITCLWYAVGFTDDIRPEEFFHGGVIFGMLLFVVLIFIVGILLINVFASVIYYYLTSTKRVLNEQEKATRISFWQFLKAEYGEVIRRFLCCIFKPKKYKRGNRTVAENVAMELDRQENKELLRSRSRNYKPKARPTDEEQHADYLRRLHRVISLDAVLEVQMEILERHLLGDKYGNIPTPPDSDVEVEIHKWGKAGK